MPRSNRSAPRAPRIPVPSRAVLAAVLLGALIATGCKTRKYNASVRHDAPHGSAGGERRFTPVAWDVDADASDFAADAALLRDPARAHADLLGRLGAKGGFAFPMPEFQAHAKHMKKVVELQREAVREGDFVVDDAITRGLGLEEDFATLQARVSRALDAALVEPPAYDAFLALCADWSLLVTRAAWDARAGRAEIAALRFDPVESWRKAHRAIKALPGWKTVFFWPLFVDVSLEDLLLTSSSEVFPVGVTAKQDLRFDGRWDAPIGFLAHDMIHSRKMMESSGKVKAALDVPSSPRREDLLAYHGRWQARFAPQARDMEALLADARKRPAAGVDDATVSAILFTFLHELHGLDEGCRVVPEGEKAIPWTYWSLANFGELRTCLGKASIRPQLVRVVMFHMHEENGVPLEEKDVAASMDWMSAWRGSAAAR